MTTFCTDVEIERIARGLLERTLPKSEWTHAAHFAAAIWLLRHRPDLTGVVEMRRIICAYNEATGTANTTASGYHETITIASCRAAAAFLVRYPPGMALHPIANALLQSALGRSDWLLAYWSRALLFSESARRAWVEPDIAPIPYEG
jgi:hypothetical protein